MPAEPHVYLSSSNSTILKVLQYNIRKSRDIVIVTLLRDERVIEYDILAILEEPVYVDNISSREKSLLPMLPSSYRR